MKIIGFGHRSRVGKDTCCKFLATHFRLAQQPVEVVSFADELKAVVHRLWGWAGVKDKQHYDNHPEDRLKIIPELGMHYIGLLVKVGTEYAREIHPDTWVRLALHRFQRQDMVLLVTDVRFPNEAAVLQNAGGVCVRIDRPSVPKLDTLADNALADFTGWDYVIKNEGTLHELREAAIAVSTDYLSR